MQPISFFRQKFDVILAAALFLIVFTVMVTNRNPELASTLKDVTQAFIYALLTLIGVRGIQAAASAVGPATTESGDINIQPPPTESAKEKLQNEIPQGE